MGGVNAEGTEFVPIPESEMKVSAQCNRVPVIDGHTECISLRFANRPAPSVEDVKQCLREYECAASNWVVILHQNKPSMCWINQIDHNLD